MPTWPSSLPAPLKNGYALNPVDPNVRTDMEVGAARTRSRTRARNDRLDLSWIFTEAQMAAFRAWFDDEATGISGGASWFTISLNLGGATSVVDARFQAMWKTQKEGNAWRMSATLEVR
jgi:hypothetical protein